MIALPRLALILPADAEVAKRLLAGLPEDSAVEVRPVVAEQGSAFEAGRRWYDEGQVDGLVLVEDPITGPLLRLRDGVRVVEAYPGLPLREILERAQPKGLARIAKNAHDLLRGFGVERPRLTLFDLPGLRGLEQACQLARAQGVDLRGPFPAGQAAEEGGDALVALTQAQTELPLALVGSGPETWLSLERPFARALPDPVSLAAALQRLGAAVREGVWGSLAAEREASRSVAASVSVARRSRSKLDAGRCPYCHRLLTESADGALGSPGPPVVCTECGTGHHRDCLQEHGQCTVLGCTNTRFTRLGFELELAQLVPADPVRAPFVSLEGDAGLGPLWLRVEVPMDDPATPPSRALALEVGKGKTFRRGELVQGYVVVRAPRPLLVRGGILRLRASLTTHKAGGSRNTARTHPILARQASFVGEAPASALGRLQDNVVSLLGGKAGVTIPAGTRRYPFSFRVHERHPKTVRNEHGGTVESVSTSLEVLLDTQSAFLTLGIL